MLVEWYTDIISSCAAEFFVSIFHLFFFMKNTHVSNVIIWLAEHLSQTILSFSVVFCLV